MSNYKYQGIELTPAVFKDLLIQFFDGKQFSHQEAVDEIQKYHLENGGLLTKATYLATFKKAAQQLKDAGIENVGYGIWRLRYNTQKFDVTPIPAKSNDFVFSSDKIIGSGTKSVYVYYYDAYKNLSTLQGKSSWECKIGRTDVDPISRIISQAGTCYPELPHIALIINCDDSNLLEKTLHDILKLKKRWLSNSPGKEWFITSPEEVEQIYVSLTE